MSKQQEKEQERKNKLIAFFSTLGIQIALFVLLFVMVAYRPPNPPYPQLGIELNLGFDDEGGGDNPATTPVGDDGNQPEETQDQPQKVQEEVKEVVAEEAKPTDAKPTEDDVLSSTEESPFTVKKKEEKAVEKPKEKVEEKKPEVKPEKPAATYTPPTDSKATGTKEGKPGSEGDDEGKTGNKGKPEGTLVKGGQYTGTPGGGGGGSSLELSGWAWDEKPNPQVPSNESGRVVFEIKVDDNGDIVSIKTLERSISQEAEQICRKAIEKLAFIQTGANVPAISTGKITFLIRSR